MGRWRTRVLVGLGLAACGGDPAGLTQTAEILPDPGGTGSSSQDDTVVGSTSGGWGGGGSEGEGRGGEGSSSDGPDDVPIEPDADPGPDGNTVVSGSRLHRRELATPDGASGETTLWDSELEVPCSSERASDGEQRCMPDLRGMVMFSDLECTQPMIASYWSCGETDYRYARGYLGESDCDWTIEAYAATEGEVPRIRRLGETSWGKPAAASAQRQGEGEGEESLATRAAPIGGGGGHQQGLKRARRGSGARATDSQEPLQHADARTAADGLAVSESGMGGLLCSGCDVPV